MDRQDVVQLPPGAATVQLARVAPNPCTSAGARIYLDVARPQPGKVTVDIVDVRGHLVRRLAARNLQPGSHVVAWDGRDASGRALASGIYFCHPRAAGCRSGSGSWTRIAMIK